MVEGLLQAFIFNITLIFGMFIITSVINVKFTKNGFLSSLFMGVIIGFATIIVMMNSFKLDTGIVYDARSVVIGIAALFMPFVSSFVGTVIAIIYRLSLGGVGIYPGVSTMVSAFLIGIIWKQHIQPKLTWHIFIQYYVFGLVVHLFTVLSQLTLPYPRNFEVIPIVTPVFLGIFPIATLVLAVAIQNQMDRINTQQKLIDSEVRFRTMFDESPASLVVHDILSGDAIDANKIAMRLYGVTSLADLNRVMWDKEGMFSREKALHYIQQAVHKEQSFVWKSKDIHGHVFYESVLLRPVIIDGIKRILSASIDITEKKHIEDDLEKFKKIVTEAEYGAALANSDGFLVYVNDSFTRMLGYHNDELLGQHILSLHSQQQHQIISELMGVLRTEGRIQSIELFHMRKDGTLIPTIMSASKVMSDDTMFFSASVMDVSQIKLSEQRYRLVSRLSKTGVWEYDPNANFLWCSPEYFSMLGYNPHDFYLGPKNLDNTWLDLIHPDDCEQAAKNFASYFELKPKTMYENHFRLKTADGQYRWIWSRGDFVRDEQGQPTDMIVGTHIDMTDFRQQEIEKMDLKNQLSLLVSEMPIGLALHEMIYDVDGTPRDYRYLSVNEKFEELTGLKADDIIGKTVLEVLPSTELYWIETYGNVATNGEPISFENYAQELNKYYSVKAYSPKQGQFAVLFEDITERKLVEEKVIYASKHDYLTGLPNRRYFDEKINELDHPRYYPLIVSMMDIDGLKLINDTLGHLAGDQAIIETARLLESSFNHTGFVARTGGDEFMILSPNTELDEFKTLRNQMIQAMSLVKIQGIELTISFGIAQKTSRNELIEEILIETENNMYANKVLHGKSARNQIIVTLFDALKEKYEEERVHSSRVSYYCAKMGEQLELSESEKLELELAGRMHDIGKISIPDYILRKTDKLSDDEWQIMKNHTTYGYQILRTADQYSRLAEYALTHHERIDGKGYPQGLKGSEIPLFSRIISICDSFEAMTSDRQYRKALTHEQAIEELKRCSGSQFDEQLVELFINNVLNERK